MFRYDCGEGFQGSLIKTIVQLGNGSIEIKLFNSLTVEGKKL